MTEVAAPAAAPSTPQTTPNGGADPQPGQASAPNPGSEQSANAQRIELAKLPPNTIVTVIADGEEREMTAADAFKFLGRGFSANKRFEDAKAERMTAAQERAEAQRMIEEIAGAVGDPARFRRILAENGITPAQWAQALLQADEQESRLTPEQRELREYKAREEERKRADRENETKAYEQERAAAREGYTRAFHGLMTEEGIPEGHVSRDLLMPTLARAARYAMETYGRPITKTEVRQVIANAKREFGALAQPPAPVEPPAPPRTAPQLARQEARDPNTGRYRELPPTPAARLNVNGQRMVKRRSDVWG